MSATKLISTMCVTLSLLLLFASGTGYAKNAIATTAKDSNPLTLSGSTTRKLLFFNIYKISHYMAWPQETPNDMDGLLPLISNCTFYQRVELEFLRDVSRSQIEKSLIEGIARNNPDINLAQIKREIHMMAASFDERVEKNATLTLSRQSKDRLVVYLNDDKRVEIDSRALADALWSIWFGDNPIVDTEELVENLIE